MRNRRKLDFERVVLTAVFLAVLICAGMWAITTFAEGEKPVSEAATAPPPAAETSVVSGTAEKTETASSTPTASSATTTAQTASGEEAAEEAELTAGNVTVNFKGADIRTVLAYISEVAGIDIVPAPDVKGPVDLKLTNKPWKVALDIIVRNYGFAYERDGDIIRVVTVDRLKQEELVTQAFSLNYGKAKDVVTSIKDIVGDRGKIMYDERTNIVLVTDIPTSIYKIGQIIEKLDKRTEQVLIEARIIETLLNEDEKLGIDWNVKVSVTGAKRPTTLPFEAFKTPFNTKSGEGQTYFPQVQSTAATSVSQTSGGATTATVTNTSDFPARADGIFSFPFATKDYFTFGTLDFSQFSAVLEAIKARSNTDIISNPRIATLNNSEAIINVGQTINLPKYERNSTTGKMEITGYDPKDLGIILKVVPHINEKEEIIVDLMPEISDLVRYDTLDKASGVVAPVFSSRQARTNVMIKDGDTIFIGGLIKENDVHTRKKLPFLGDMFGDVPYLGLFFTKKEVTKEKRELIFFITVNLIKPGKEIRDMPAANRAHVPTFIATQEKDSQITKRKLKKRF